MFGIAEFRVPIDQSSPILPIHTSLCGRTKLPPPSRHIDGSDIPARRRGTAAMEPQLTIEKFDVQDFLLPSVMGLSLARNPRLNIRRDRIEN